MARPSGRSVAIAGARVVTGVVTLAVAALVVGGVALIDPPTVTSTRAPVSGTPSATAQQRVCVGSGYLLGTDTAAAGAATQVGGVTPVVGTAAGDLTRTAVATPDDASAKPAGAPLLLTTVAAPARADIALLAGAQSQTLRADDASGFLASACGVATGDSWLVGGSTAAGSTTLLLLVNPTGVESTATVTVYGEKGAISGSGASAVVVPAGSQKVVSLAGIAPDVTATAVHVESRGGGIRATLQQTDVSGIDALGADLVAPEAATAADLVIPGMRVADVKSGGNASDSAVPKPRVRVVVPGDDAATVTVTATNERTGRVAVTKTLTLTGGLTGETALSSLPAGSYTVRVHADQPVAASARSDVAGGGAQDFAWYAAAASLTGTVGVAIAAGPSPQLHVADTGDTAQTLTVTGSDGTTKTVRVPAGGSAVLAVKASATYTVSGGTGVALAVSYLSGSTAAGYTIDAPVALGGAVAVVPR
jgi:Family of unknown function (DUF5719)